MGSIMARRQHRILLNDVVVDEKFDMEDEPPYLSTAVLTLLAV
jgi:hypothetical protein